MDEIKKLTIADVAEHLGVSKTTVSRAISGKGRISEETRTRVLEYIEAADYKPNVIAKGLAQSKTYNIAVILPIDCNLAELPFFQNCMCGICEAASARDYDVLTVYTKAGETGDLERIIANNKIDGVVLSRTLVKDTTAEYIKKKKVPLVAVGSSSDEHLIQVDHDHRSACRELTRNLLETGLRKVGLIGGNEAHMVTRNRYEGFADAFRMAERPVDANLLYFGAEQVVDIRRAVRQLLDKQVECIVCMDDMICNHVLQYLEEHKVNVPDAVKIASFYAGITTENTVHPVMTLEFDARKLGRVTCNTLIDLIEGKEIAAKQLLPYTMKGI